MASARTIGPLVGRDVPRGTAPVHLGSSARLRDLMPWPGAGRSARWLAGMFHVEQRRCTWVLARASGTWWRGEGGPVMRRVVGRDVPRGTAGVGEPGLPESPVSRGTAEDESFVWRRGINQPVVVGS